MCICTAMERTMNRMIDQTGTKYIDARGWKYKVMSGIGSDRFKARYQKPDKDGSVSGWKGVAAVPWRAAFAEAQADLDRLAKERGWEVWHG